MEQINKYMLNVQKIYEYIQKKYEKNYYRNNEENLQANHLIRKRNENIFNYIIVLMKKYK